MDNEKVEEVLTKLDKVVDRNQCRNCGGTKLELRNFDRVFRDGDLYCMRCGEFVRGYDAG